MPGTSTLLLERPTDQPADQFARSARCAEPGRDEAPIGAVLDALSPEARRETADELWPWVPLPGGGLELRCEAE